jgi:hypothetical protein
MHYGTASTISPLERDEQNTTPPRRGTAKMAENAQNLPKWQALQILCQIPKYYSGIFLVDIQD